MPVPRLFTTLLAALAALALSGCGYVHLGRYEAPATTDTSLAAENSGLRVEKKILQQELAIARKEGTALRTALENRYTDTGTAQTDLVARLNETTRELATLRASYAKLYAAQALDPKSQTPDPALAATEEKLAASMRTYTELQDETNRLRSEVNRVRDENTHLTKQVGELTVQSEQATAALSQLNSELLAQKEARNRAEFETQAARTQLQLVMARSRDTATTLADARTTSAKGVDDLNATLRLENAPAPVTPPTAMLRTNPERLRAAAASLAAEDGTRYHVVVEGDTLEGIAKKYYGKPERWRVIYAANHLLLRDGRPIAPGMKLEIPAE